MKLQSAMEYLMTYGWAMLIIAVVLVALFELNLFNPNTLAPKAQPGSCSVVRNAYGGATLSGTCTSNIPKFVAQFDGASGVTMSNPLTINVNNQGYTVSAWIYTNNFAEVQAIFKGYANNYAYFGTSIQGGGQLCGWVNGICCPCPAGTTINANTWYNIVGVWAQGTGYATIYINGGSPFRFAASGSSYSNTATPEIGSVADANGYPVVFNGLISNVQIYNTSLSANSIQALYLEGIGGTPINLQNLVG